MRGLGILASALVLSAPAWASGFETQTRMNMPGITSETGAGQITSVKPGEPIAIACNALMAGPGADVRVVLTLAPVSGETETGYQKLMATNEEVLKGAVRFRIPDTQGLENHTVHLRVYVVSDKGSQSCDAGLMKIV
jgi:hypothetical protein